MSILKPCLLERKLLPKVWGGRRLETSMGIELPAGEAIGESWEVYDRPDGSSRIRGSDKTLHDLMTMDAHLLLGRARPTPDMRFPLLLKYIDASDRLSVQLHPDDELAKVEKDLGKTEAWFVLGAGPEARIVRGLKPGVTAAQFAEVAHTSAVEGLLHSFTPLVGDAVHVPAGTVHAIGPDVVVFEVQQNSDLTYRVYDWGRDREVHVDKALAALKVDSEASPKVQPERIDEHARWLIRSEHFNVRQLQVSSPASMGTDGSVKILTVLHGTGTIGWRSQGQDMPLMVRKGDTVLIPACTELVYLSPAGQFEVLWTDAGDES